MRPEPKSENSGRRKVHQEGKLPCNHPLEDRCKFGRVWYQGFPHPPQPFPIPQGPYVFLLQTLYKFQQEEAVKMSPELWNPDLLNLPSSKDVQSSPTAAHIQSHPLQNAHSPPPPSIEQALNPPALEPMHSQHSVNPPRPTPTPPPYQEKSKDLTTSQASMENLQDPHCGEVCDRCGRRYNTRGWLLRHKKKCGGGS